MKTTFDVTDRSEGDRLKTALGDPTSRALMNVIGALLPLPPRDQRRVLQFVTEHFVEQEQ